MLTGFVVSVSLRRCMSPTRALVSARWTGDVRGWWLIVSDAVTFPFLPELNAPVSLTGPLTVVLFWALGLAPPLLTQT